MGQARSRLGAAAFDALMRQGSEMSYDEISTYVIGTMDRLAEVHWLVDTGEDRCAPGYG